MLINSIFLTLASLFLIYSIGAALIRGQWKELLVAFLVFAFLGVSQVAIGAINMLWGAELPFYKTPCLFGV